MSRIGASLSGIERSLLNRLAEANAGATLSSLRMATLSKINSPADDPAAFVILSGLQSQLGTAAAAMANVTAASSMIAQVQTNLDGIRTQLEAIRTELVADEDGALSGAQRADAQANIDAAIHQIDVLVAGQINGRRLLDGSVDFQISGRDFRQATDIRVYSTGGTTRTISGSVTQAASQAELTFTGAAGQVNTNATFTLSGGSGSVEITVTAAEPLSTLQTEINANSHKTGVTAALVGDVLTLSSVNYGSDADLAVVVSSGTFNVAGGNGDGTANGTDAQATVNGQTYTGDGNQLTISQNGFHYSLELTPGFTGTLSTITVEGDALTFALSPQLTRTSTLAIPGLQPGRLGGLSGTLDQLASGGSLADLGSHTSQAIRVVDEALADLTRIEGSVDGFANAAVASTSGLLSDLQDDLQDAIDDVNLVDETEESVRLARYQDLASNSVAGLTILYQQRRGIVNMLQQIAGLLQT
jgi:flagellin-like hook-associated protein FlgL